MKKCPFDVHNIVTDPKTGRYSFTFDDGRKAITGTDVSHYVGEVDWKAVKEDGIEFVIIRAGGRHLIGNDGLYDDTRFEEYYKGATEAGLMTGAYYVPSSINENELDEEIDHLLSRLKGKTIPWPVAVDYEVLLPKYRHFGVDTSFRTSSALKFCKVLSDEGYTPMVYCNSITHMQKLLDLERLEGIEKWIAEYRFKPYYPYDFGIWQYSNTAKIRGINSEGDLNLCFKDYSTI